MTPNELLIVGLIGSFAFGFVLWGLLMFLELFVIDPPTPRRRKGKHKEDEEE